MICLTEKEDCLHPCSQSGHIYCQDCWGEWTGSFKETEMMISCPTCRGICFKDPLAQCCHFRITRLPDEGREEYPDPHHEIELANIRGSNIHQAFALLRSYLMENPHLSIGIFIDEVKVYANETILVDKSVILYAGREEEDMDLRTYYENQEDIDILPYLPDHPIFDLSYNEEDLIHNMNQYH